MVCVCVFLLGEGEKDEEEENEGIRRNFGFLYMGRGKVAGLRVVSRVSPGNSRIDPYRLSTFRFSFRFTHFINLGTFTNLTSIYFQINI